MDFKDYYATLGVQKGATDKEIRSAFRRLARKYHPDVNPGDADAEVRFKEINEANEVLSDPEKRVLYDELGPRWKEYQDYKTAGGAANPAEFLRGTSGRTAREGNGAPRYEYRTMNPEDINDLFGGGNPFSDFFQQTFGFAGRGSGSTGPGTSVPGQDIEQRVDITLNEALNGTTRTLQYADAAGPRRIEAKIPPGIRAGSRVRLAGQGASGLHGGKSGDLYLVVDILPDPQFHVDDSDIHVSVNVPLYICILGGEVPVPTPKGSRVALRIPPNTQNGRVFRLSGLGVPPTRKNGSAGNLLARINVVLPTELTKEEVDLVRQLAEIEASKRKAAS